MFSLNEMEGKKEPSLKEENQKLSKGELLSGIIGSQAWMVMGRKFNIGTFKDIYYMDWHDFVYRVNSEYLSTLY